MAKMKQLALDTLELTQIEPDRNKHEPAKPKLKPKPDVTPALPIGNTTTWH